MNETEAYLKQRELIDTLSLLNDLAYSATGKPARFYFTGFDTVCIIEADSACIHESAMNALKQKKCVSSAEFCLAVRSWETTHYRIVMNRFEEEG